MCEFCSTDPTISCVVCGHGTGKEVDPSEHEVWGNEADTWEEYKARRDAHAKRMKEGRDAE